MYITEYARVGRTPEAENFSQAYRINFRFDGWMSQQSF